MTYHLRFSQEGEFLVSSSNTGSVHIYSLSLEPSERSGWMETMKTGFLSAASYLMPDSYQDSLETNRSFIIVRTYLDTYFLSCLVKETNVLLVITSDYKGIVYKVNLERGGDGVKEGEISI